MHEESDEINELREPICSTVHGHRMNVPSRKMKEPKMQHSRNNLVFDNNAVEVNTLFKFQENRLN
jgi:hypothetical protein